MTNNENELMEVKKLKELKENILSLFSSGVGTTMTEFCVPIEIDNLIKHMENTRPQPSADLSELIETQGYRLQSAIDFIESYLLDSKPHNYTKGFQHTEKASCVREILWSIQNVLLNKDTETPENVRCDDVTNTDVSEALQCLDKLDELYEKVVKMVIYPLLNKPYNK